MSFPVSAAERKTLVPVIAMLLQFTPAEVKGIEMAESDQTWIPRTAKELVRPRLEKGSSGTLNTSGSFSDVSMNTSSHPVVTDTSQLSSSSTSAQNADDLPLPPRDTPSAGSKVRSIKPVKDSMIVEGVRRLSHDL